MESNKHILTTDHKDPVMHSRTNLFPYFKRRVCAVGTCAPIDSSFSAAALTTCLTPLPAPTGAFRPTRSPVFLSDALCNKHRRFKWPVDDWNARKGLAFPILHLPVKDMRPFPQSVTNSIYNKIINSVSINGSPWGNVPRVLDDHPVWPSIIVRSA